MQASWRPIKPFEFPEGGPQLFLKYSFSDSGYSVWLTDLSRIYGETIERRQLIRRALNENTSIDPTEDASQLKILLQKIKSALAGESETALRLLKGGEEDGLTLQTISSLPQPFGELLWPITLSLQPTYRLGTELVVPALTAAYNSSQLISNLISEIHDKDHVISKLLDRLEQSGTDLSTVFPGAAGVKSNKKAISRSRAARHVRGLGPFDVDRWRDDITYAQPSETVLGELVQKAFQNTSDEDSIDLSHYGAWWTSLGTQSQAGELLNELRKRPEADVTTVTGETNGQTGSDQAVLDDDETTEDEEAAYEDLDRPEKLILNVASTERGSDATTTEPPRDQAPSPAPIPAGSKKLGRIGGNSKELRTLKKESPVGQEIASNIAEPSPTSEDPMPLAPKKSKLGVIGGRVRSKPADPAQERETTDDHDNKDLRSRETNSLALRSISEASENRPSTPERSSRAGSDQPEETPKQRADKRRAELKRELEEKSKVQVKKKRRF